MYQERVGEGELCSTEPVAGGSEPCQGSEEDRVGEGQLSRRECDMF